MCDFVVSPIFRPICHCVCFPVCEGSGDACAFQRQLKQAPCSQTCRSRLPSPTPYIPKLMLCDLGVSPAQGHPLDCSSRVNSPEALSPQDSTRQRGAAGFHTTGPALSSTDLGRVREVKTTPHLHAPPGLPDSESERHRRPCMGASLAKQHPIQCLGPSLRARLPLTTSGLPGLPQAGWTTSLLHSGPVVPAGPVPS